MPKKQQRAKRKRQAGLPPGSLVYTGGSEETAHSFQLFKFDEKGCTVISNKNLEPVIEKVDAGKKCWLKIVGLNQVENIQKVGQAFHISPLVLEDILDVNQRPKCDIFKDYLFFTLKMLYKNPANTEGIAYQQFSIILTENLIISFQEKEEEWLSNLTGRLEKQDTSLRAKPIGYLFYRLVDTIVDYYYVELDSIEERIEDLEININEKVQDEDLKSIQKLKRDLITLRKYVYPLREAISLARKDGGLLLEPAGQYLSDVYDHTIHVVETIETYRDLTSGLMDLYMTGISNRMNEIMKVLTIIATIFIPLTFIAGVYGMNFKYMPELAFKWAYPATILVMAVIALGMVLYFKRKKWL